jgi:hypothetical protein
LLVLLAAVALWPGCGFSKYGSIKPILPSQALYGKNEADSCRQQFKTGKDVGAKVEEMSEQNRNAG